MRMIVPILRNADLLWGNVVFCEEHTEQKPSLMQQSIKDGLKIHSTPKASPYCKNAETHCLMHFSIAPMKLILIVEVFAQRLID